MTNDKTLVQYVKNRQGQRVGAVVAKRFDDMVVVGWSFTNIKAGDVFDKAKALLIATGRCERNSTSTIPRVMEPVIQNIVNRSDRYFRGAKVITVAGQTMDYPVKVGGLIMGNAPRDFKPEPRPEVVSV